MPPRFEREPEKDVMATALYLAEQIYTEDRLVGIEVLREMMEMLPESGTIKELCKSRELHLYKDVVVELPLQEALLYYIDFVNTRTDLRSFHDEILDDLAGKLEDTGELSDTEKWLIGVLIDSVSDEMYELFGSLSGYFYIKPMLSIWGKKTELREKIFPVIMNFVRATDSKDRERVFNSLHSRVGATLSFRLIGEYFKGSTDYDTFFSGKIFEIISGIIEKETSDFWGEVDWKRVGSDTIQALHWCFENIEECLPDIEERGHTKFVLRGSRELLDRFPEAKTLMGGRLLASIGKLKEKRSSKKAGRMAGKLNDDYNYLSGLYDSSPTTAQIRLSRIIEKEGSDYELSAILNDLFTSSESKELDGDYLFSSLEVRQIRDCLSKNELVLELMVLMADNPEYRFQMGVLLSMIDFSELPERIKRRLDVEETERTQKLLVKNEEWYLCGDAEPRMAEAMYNGGVLLVNDNLLVKFNGKLAAMCLRSFTTKGGFTFLRGNWYCPVDEATRNTLEGVFREGETRVNLRFNSEWVLMRPVAGIGGNTHDEFVDEAIRVTKTLEARHRRNFRMESQ